MLFKSLPALLHDAMGALSESVHVCRKGRPLIFELVVNDQLHPMFLSITEPSRINFFSRRLIMTANTRTIDCIKFGIDGQYTREDIKVIDLCDDDLHAGPDSVRRGSGLGRTASIQPRKNSIVLSVSH